MRLTRVNRSGSWVPSVSGRKRFVRRCGCGTADQPSARASRFTWPAKTATKSPPCRPVYSPGAPEDALDTACGEESRRQELMGANTPAQLSDQRMLIARAITRAARVRDTIDSKITISLAQTRTADTSVGLNARAVLNDKAR